MLILALWQAAVLGTAPPPTRFVLPNGLRVWVHEEHARPVALVQVTYKAGSIDEEPGKTGIAHYVEHMVYRATGNIRNEDIYGYIDRIGGRYTGGTWPELTRYAETVPSWALESALRVTAERMCCALFDSTEFERERGNVVTEANGFSDSDPVSALRDAVMYASFEAHPYRLNSNTWARDNLVLTRDDAFDWYKRYYGPNNAVLVIVGDVATDDVRRLVEKHFGAIPRAKGSGFVRVVEPPQRVAKRLTLTHPTAPPRVEIVYRAPSAAQPDFPTLRVFRRVLNQRMSAALVTGRLHGGFSIEDSASQYPFVLRISLTPDSTADPDRMLASVQSQIDSLGRTGATASELAAAANASPARIAPPPAAEPSIFPPRRSTLTRMADSLTDREALSWEVSSALLERIARAERAVTSDDIRTYVAHWLRQSQRTVGVLMPGADDFVARWSDHRPLVGERMEIPPQTTPPAKRMRPDAVPARALEPLAPLPIATARRVLPNRIVLRAARIAGSRVAIQVRADSGAASDSGGHADLRRTVPANQAPAALDSLALLVKAGRVAGSISVAIVGSAKVDALLGSAARAFESVPRPQELTPQARRRDLAPRDTAILVAGRTQVAIVGRLSGVPRDHPDRRALELLNYIVGVPSYGGRLGWALTKAGLTYSAAARTTFAAATGDIALTTTADTRNAPAVIQAIREVVTGVGANGGGVEEWELREAQAFTLGRATLYGARDDSPPAAIATALLDSELAGVEYLDLPAFSRAYLAVTLAEINRVAQVYYRPELLSISATGAIPRRDERTIFPEGTFRAIFEP